MARSLNRVQLIGNLTRDPELRYTPAGTAVCTFGLATNRQWITEAGEKKEEAEFHRIVAWQKLAELCAQLLTKGRKVYIEGRLQTRRWTGQDGTDRTTIEIVANDMIILDSRLSGGQGETFEIPEGFDEEVPIIGEESPQQQEKVSAKNQDAKEDTDEKQDDEKSNKKTSGSRKDNLKEEEVKDEEEDSEDIPF